MMGCPNWNTSIIWILFAYISLLLVPNCSGVTDPRDVFAINSLYAALQFPVIPGWVPVGGDPCAENWQGVQCVNANITGIILDGANLGGELGANLGDFTSIIQIDLSNNHIGGVVPSNLPSTIQTFFLSGNQLIGSIPDTLSSLGQLVDLSFSDNHLSGVVPDAFQQLSGLINLNLSGNNLSGHLPPSMGNLSYLTTLHLQNNKLIGTLDILQDLPLRDLDIENNLFSGPIPPKLLSVPNFRRAGNPFNTSIIPSPPATPPLPSLADPPSSDLAPTHQAFRPPSSQAADEETHGKSRNTKRIVWIAIAVALVLIVLILGMCLLVSRCSKGIQPTSKLDRANGTSSFDDPKQKSKDNGSFPRLYSPREKGYKEPGLRPLIIRGKDHQRTTLSSTPKTEELSRTSSISKASVDHTIDMSSVLSEDFLPPPPPPFFPINRVNMNPLLSPISTTEISTRIPSTVRSFNIATLQQYTDSFSQENLIGKGALGNVYRAETSTGRILAVKKLDTAVCNNQSNEDFLELVCNISKIQHLNIVELVGYCAEHGQQLLVYDFFGNGTLYEALHLDDEIHKNLSWNTRIRLALGAARALEYMHEVCKPPMVHKNFKSANILLDDELVVHVSDCGLAPLLPSGSLTQLSSSGYGAPELELGTYTIQSDVYSFGVVMLEILTGRKSYDRSRPREERFLVRWAIHKLHDIDSLAKMVDPSLNGAYPTKSLSRFADIISLCLQPEPEFRPPMSEIVQNLLHMI